MVAIFGADHIYRMNIRQMIEYHVEKRAGVTVAAIPVEKEMAIEFGVVEATPNGNITGFHEKKADAPTIPGDPTRVYASMGNYIFSTDLLVREILADAKTQGQRTRFRQGHFATADWPGRHVRLRFSDEHHSRRSDRSAQYWRDVGTLDAYYEASMDLRSVSPALNLYNRQWPLRTAGYFDAPAKFVFDEDGRRGMAIDSIIAGSSIISGGSVSRSVLGRGVRIHTGAEVEDSVIFDNCDIGRHAKVRRAILDKNVKIPEGTEIGYQPEEGPEEISRHRERDCRYRRPPVDGGHRDAAGLRVASKDPGGRHLPHL